MKLLITANRSEFLTEIEKDVKTMFALYDQEYDFCIKYDPMVNAYLVEDGRNPKVVIQIEYDLK